MKDNESLKKLVNSLNTGKTFPAMQLVKSNPEAAAILSKLVKPHIEADFDLSKKSSYFSLNQGQLQSISESIKNRTKDNDNILSLFPDIELAIQIEISSILSPKDMVNSVLIYKTKDTVLPSELLLKLNNIVSSNMEGYYDIKKDLPDILRETLFSTGSYVKTVLPESVVDEIINGSGVVSTEGIKEIFGTNNTIPNLGILGKPGVKDEIRIGIESFSEVVAVTDYVCHLPGLVAKETESDDAKKFAKALEITDNYKLLKLPKLIQANNKNKLKNIIASESRKLSNTQLSTALYKNNSKEVQTFLSIPKPSNAKRKSIGRPLVIKLPSESVIPIFTPGDETKHIGYFVLIDVDGNPVSHKSNIDSIDGLSNISTANMQDKLPGSLLERARKNLHDDSGNITLDQITKVYGNIVETDLTDRLRNGIYGNNVEVGDNQEVYRIMLARSLAGKYTRLVFVPAELITYFAFKYFNNGVGKSYLDDVKILTSIRAILLFTKVMAMTKNSIAVTHVNMVLDPDDPDPNKTVELGIHEVIRMRQQYFPLGINSPTALTDWVQRAGLEFTFEGHPGLPNTKFEFESKSMNHVLPDDNLDELLRKQTYMAFGLSPETVDNGMNAEFATTVIANNVLFAKRITMLGEIFSDSLTDYCRKVATNDNIIQTELLGVLKENVGVLEKYFSDEEKEVYKETPDLVLNSYIELYIENLEIALPKPDVTSIENQTAAFTEYSDALDKTIDSWISSGIITNDVSGELSQNIDTIRAIIKAYLTRNWMANNGYMPELSDIVTADEDGNPNMNLYELNRNHIEGVMRSCLKFLESMKDVKDAADKDLANLGVVPGESDSSSGDMSSDSSTDMF